MNVVALIPARAGSKRLPDKALADLRGRPLISYTCEAALHSGVLSAVFVNTDCPGIAAQAERFGVRCPFLRPARLATDGARSCDANRFLLPKLLENGERYDALMVLQPTSPLRTAADIRAALGLFQENAPCAVVSVSPVAPASWLGRVAKDGHFDPLPGEEHLHRLNGAIYIYTVDDFLADRRPARTMVHPMPGKRGVDIDTPEDLAYADFLLARAERAESSQTARRPEAIGANVG